MAKKIAWTGQAKADVRAIGGIVFGCRTTAARAPRRGGIRRWTPFSRTFEGTAVHKGQERALNQPVLLRWQRRQAGTLLPLGKITVRESRGPAS